MKKLFFLILILVLISGLYGKEVSTKKAMVFSLILPGSGELYAHNYNKAAGFFCTEATIIFAYFRLKSETEWAKNSYQQFAFSKADVSKDQDDSYYQLIQDYRSSDSFNASIYRDARNYFLIYKNDPIGYENYLEQNLVPQDMEWDWETTQSWLQYKELRREKQNLEVYTKFTFAAAILNRVISFIDAAITAKKYNRFNSEIGTFHIEPDWRKKGMKIYYEYKF